MGIPLDSTKRGEQVISLYTWYVGGKQTSISIVSLWWPSGFHPVTLMRASAQWGRQSHEGVSLRVSYKEYYANWRTRKMPLAFIVAVNPCCRCKTSAYSWLHHLLIFLPHQEQCYYLLIIARILCQNYNYKDKDIRSPYFWAMRMEYYFEHSSKKKTWVHLIYNFLQKLIKYFKNFI